MRTSLLFLLLASTAATAAAAQEPGADLEARIEAAREERAQRAERRERSSGVARIQREPGEERSDPAPEPRRRMFGGFDRPAEAGERDAGTERGVARGFGRSQRGGRAELPGAGTDQDPGDTVRDWRMRERANSGSPSLVEQRNQNTPDSMRDWRQRQLERFARRGDADGRTPPAISRVPREGTQPPPPQTRRPANISTRHWSGDWRRDRRYNWSDWRRRHRSRFHLGIYFDPFGWRYRPFHIGWRMWPSYYGRDYWLNDPWSYRLPYAPYPYRWIRYYDDALLVDTWSGEVVDVVYGFFW